MPYEEYLEITTKIGCPVNCNKYCPQDLIVKKYGKQQFTLESFAKMMETVTPGIPINFSGICEPFANPETIDMIEHAAKNHPIRIFTTLVGLTPEQAKRLVKTPIQIMQLHLPDAQVNAKIPITEEYLQTLKIILEGVNNVTFMNMGGLFESNNNENMHRDPSTCKRRSGRVICGLHDKPGYGLMPDGDVYFCCMGRGLSDKVGSLKENTYPELVERHKAMAQKLQSDPQSTCHICMWAVPYYIYKVVQVKNWLREHYDIKSDTGV